MSDIKLKPMVQKIIGRISRLSFNEFVEDRCVITNTFRVHLRRLGLPMIPIHFYKDLNEGYTAALSAAESATWSTAWSTALSAAWSDAKSTAWSAAKSAAESAALSAAESVTWSAAWSTTLSTAWSAAWSAAKSAAESAIWFNCSNLKSKQYGAIWLPFLRASEAGLWLYWITTNEIIVVPRPVVHLQDGQLHDTQRPAVEWPHGTSWFYLHGVRMEPWMVETPAETLNATKILAVTNAEQRRELIRKVGVERLLAHLPHRVLDTRGEMYELLSIQFSDDLTDARVLKMRNPSIGIWHLERVEDDCATVEEALNWRNTGHKEVTWTGKSLT